MFVQFLTFLLATGISALAVPSLDTTTNSEAPTSLVSRFTGGACGAHAHLRFKFSIQATFTELTSMEQTITIYDASHNVIGGVTSRPTSGSEHYSIDSQ
jgi:hypothetical protein